MKSLFDEADRVQLLARLNALRPDAERRWGRMSLGGMLCHLDDAFLAVLGEREVARRPRLYERTLMRWAALHTPLPWPRGVKSIPSVDQERGGTPPEDFEKDRARLLGTIGRFVGEIDPDASVHPIFGKMSADEWGHWGWRHMDHHLRQFGG